MKQEIIEKVENNKLIAEFMQLQKRQNIIEGRILDYLVNGYWTIPGRFKYHSSWDWLMPVVEKIEGMDFKQFDNFEKMYVVIQSNRCKILNYHTGTAPFAKQEGYTKIYATWKAVIQFIEWYNEYSLIKTQ